MSDLPPLGSELVPDSGHFVAFSGGSGVFSGRRMSRWACLGPPGKAKGFDHLLRFLTLLATRSHKYVSPHKVVTFFFRNLLEFRFGKVLRSLSPCTTGARPPPAAARPTRAPKRRGFTWSRSHALVSGGFSFPVASTAVCRSSGHAAAVVGPKGSSGSRREATQRPGPAGAAGV